MFSPLQSFVSGSINRCHVWSMAQFLSNTIHACTSLTSYLCSKSTINPAKDSIKLLYDHVWQVKALFLLYGLTDISLSDCWWLQTWTFSLDTCWANSSPRSSLTPTAGMWTSFSQLLFIWRRLSPDIQHGGKTQTCSSGIESGSIEKPTPLGKKDFFPQWIPHTQHTLGMMTSWIQCQILYARYYLAWMELRKQNTDNLWMEWNWTQGLGFYSLGKQLN